MYADKSHPSHIISSHHSHVNYIILYITIIIITVTICYTLNFAITGEKTFVITAVTSITVF